MCTPCGVHSADALPPGPLPPHRRPLTPGETEEQYQRTEDLVRAIGFDRVNTAAYSPRPNTPAAEWGEQVADLIKADRLNRLNAVVTEVRAPRRMRGRRPPLPRPTTAPACCVRAAFRCVCQCRGPAWHQRS